MFFMKYGFVPCIPLYVWCFFSDPCTENEVRLNDVVVQVCHDAQWGLVCHHQLSWDLNAAEVVCKQVGIPSRSQCVYLEREFCFQIISLLPYLAQYCSLF